MSTPRPRPAVPAYFHPVRDAGTWELLRRRRVDLVVVNPCSGVGAATDPAYVDVCAGRLRRTIAGYIDTAYARRPIIEVVGEAVAYVRRYGVGSVFLDKGFMSTSHTRGGAFSGTKVRLKVPAGQRMIAGTDYEKEMILPPGTMYRKVGTWIDSKSGTVYQDFELVYPA